MKNETLALFILLSFIVVIQFIWIIFLSYKLKLRILSYREGWEDAYDQIVDDAREVQNIEYKKRDNYELFVLMSGSKYIH